MNSHLLVKSNCERGVTMKKKLWMGLVLVLFIAGGGSSWAASEMKPIIFGAALPLGDPTGVEANRGAVLAVEEINKEGGINLPDGMHPVKLEVMDSRDLEPGVPVSEALLAAERLILDKKVQLCKNCPHSVSLPSCFLFWVPQAAACG